MPVEHATPLQKTLCEELSTRVQMDVVTQHVEDAAFLFLKRERAVLASHMGLAQLVRLDERLEANLDGIRVAGGAGWSLALEALGSGQSGEVFTAMSVALAMQELAPIQAIVRTASGRAEFSKALIAALGFAPDAEVLPVLEGLSKSEDASSRELALKGFATRRIDPGACLIDGIFDADLAVQASAFELAASLGRTDLSHLVVRQVTSPHKLLRFHAAYSAARMGIRDSDVLATLRSFANEESAFGVHAMELVVRCMPVEEASSWALAMLRQGQRPRFALCMLAAIGDLSLFLQADELLARENTARLAGYVFTGITGSKLEEAGLDRPKPENFDAGPNDDPVDANVMMDEDEEMDWPSAERLASWCHDHGDRFQPGRRYLCGQPVAKESLLRILHEGCQPARAAAALELGVLYPAEPLFPVHARAHFQLQRLAQPYPPRGGV